MPGYHRWSTLLSALSSRTRALDVSAMLPLALELSADVGDATVACSLTEFEGSAYRTPIASADLARVLDEAQYAAGNGPCMVAAREQQPHRVDDLEIDAEFPEFAAAAVALGVRSSLSVPIVGMTHRTALNLYSAESADYISTHARDRAALLAHCVAAASTVHEPGAPVPDVGSNERDDAALHHARRQAELVDAALRSVMVGDKLDRGAAFAVLTQRSRRDGTGIAEVARRELGDHE